MAGPAQEAQSKGGRTRRRILDAAASLVATAGNTEVTLSDIARAAELRPASLYFHFRSKDEVVAEMLAVGMEEAMAHLERALDAAPATAAAQLLAAIQAHLDARLELSDYASVVLAIGARPDRPTGGRYERDRRRYAAQWLKLIEDAQAAGVFSAGHDPRLLREFLFSAMNVELRGRWSSSDAVRALADLLRLR